MPYVQGFVIPVPNAKKDAYVALAVRTAPIFQEYGALRVVETWGDNVPDGKRTDFRKAVAAEADESVVFSWIMWPDKPTCEAAQSKIMSDARMQPGKDMPFDGKRMIYGGFLPVFDSDD